MVQFEHEGVLRRSGRYPWGSGENPYQHSGGLVAQLAELKDKGFNDKEIMTALGIKSTQYRAINSIVKSERQAQDEAMVRKLKEKGMSTTEIGKRMGRPEGTIRGIVKRMESDKQDELNATVDLLRESFKDRRFVDVGAGVDAQLGISDTKLKTAVAVLEQEGYITRSTKIEFLGTGYQTTIKALTPPGTTYPEFLNNLHEIRPPGAFKNDDGIMETIKPPRSISLKRVEVRYGPDGGSAKDGTIELRRGVNDISLGSSNYAQVRIAVGGTHFLKGMAVYGDDLPDGVDIRFNTNKKDTGNKLDAMKPLEKDPASPFGASVKRQKGVLNILNEEGDWNEWNRNLPSQFLAKQPIELAKQKLNETVKTREKDYQDIMSLTNPTVKRRLLASFSDDADAAAVHLKAAAMKGQRTQVILPIKAIKEDQIYAPNFPHGERVALVRFPHGGKFEIPEVTVNNNNAEGRRVLGKGEKAAKDAIGIHFKVAERLSGADFDGDTVLVIPNRDGAVKSSPALKELKNFSPSVSYKYREGMKVLSSKATGLEMGKISNLITDMTVKGATEDELARAVKHSMVVIDAAKHKLDYKTSEKDNAILALKKKYQGNPDDNRTGAATLLSRAKSPQTVPERRPRYASEGGAIDPKTGKLMYMPTGNTYYSGKIKTVQVPRMELVDDARTLSSGLKIEEVYAAHANKMKAMANQARLSEMNTPLLKYSPSANKAYSAEVTELKNKLRRAQENSPRERQAQILAGVIVKEKIRANPDMDKDDIKKLKGRELTRARAKMGASKPYIPITPKEWQAIQSGAISDGMLKNILKNTDIDDIYQMALPRDKKVMTSSNTARAKQMLARGATRAEVASALGVSVSTLYNSIPGSSD